MIKTALVHDYLNEYGGAERVLEELSKMYPYAPIYTAFVVSGSTAAVAFKGKEIRSSWFENVPFFWKLYSPLRFFIPWIWGSFDLRDYDVIISSASWYVTKGFEKKPGAIEICYCHTPPRWLYGYTTSVNLQKYLPVRIYAAIVGHFLRMYDFKQAQKVDVFVANSKNVAERIRKFYRRESRVIYPPVEVSRSVVSRPVISRGDYYLMVTRLVGGKGIELAIEAAEKAGFKLKIAGEAAGWATVDVSGVEYLGRVSDEEKTELMRKAKGFLALEYDSDFGMTVVEAMVVGTPVIAFNGGGYPETVVDGENGVLFDDYGEEGLRRAIERFEKMKWDRKRIAKSVVGMGRDKFVKKIKRIIEQNSGA